MIFKDIRYTNMKLRAVKPTDAIHLGWLHFPATFGDPISFYDAEELPIRPPPGVMRGPYGSFLDPN